MIKNEEDSETRFTVLQNTPNILIHPYCIQRPAVALYSPQFSDTGVPRDSEIVITFNKNISKENDFSRISIMSNGESLTSCYKTPVVNENILTFAVDKNNLINVPGETRRITVTIPENFFYMENGHKVTLGKEFSWSFNVNKKTNMEEQLTISVPENKGSITPEGIQKIKIGESINVKYEPKENYIFTGWNIIDGDGKVVPESVLHISDKTLSSMTLTVSGPLNGVSITPNSYLVPAVISTSPKQDSTNVDCDTTIVMKFNKPMKSSYFKDFSETSAISITNYGVNVSQYYKPELSNDGTTLYIKPDLDNISNIFDGKASANVSFTINRKACDNVAGDEFELQNDYSLNLRLITSRETVKPEFLQFNIAKTKQDAINGTNLLSTDDLYKNLVSSLWIYCKAKDTGGAVKCIRTTEKVLQTVDGRSEEKEYKTNKDGYGTFQNIGDDIYEALFEYKYSSLDDGIVKLTFALCDYAGNQSEEIKEYVTSKDTHFTMACYDLDGIPDLENSKSKSPVNLPVGNIAVPRFKLKVTDGVGNIHAGNSCTKNDSLTFSIYAGTSEENLELLATINNISEEFSVRRDIRYNTLVRIVGSDECGNSASKDWYIPKIIKPVVVKYYEDTKNLSFIIPAKSGTDGLYKNDSAAIAYSFNDGELKFVVNGGSGDTTYSQPGIYNFYTDRETGKYKIYLLPVISHADNSNYRAAYGSIDLDYCISYDWNKETSTLTLDESTLVPDFTKNDIPSFNVSVSSLNSQFNTYKYEIKLNEPVITNPNISFVYVLTYEMANNDQWKDSYYRNIYSFDSSFIYDGTKNSYTRNFSVKILAVDDKEIVRAESDPVLADNDDHLAPTYVYNNYISVPYGKRIYPDFKDEDGGSGLTDTFNYYIVPTNMLSTAIPVQSMESIKASFTPVTVKYSDKIHSKYYYYRKVNGKDPYGSFYEYDYYDIYYDGKIEQNYAIYYELKDKAGNLLFAPCTSIMSGSIQKRTPEFSAFSSSGNDFLKISYVPLLSKRQAEKLALSYLENNEWIIIDGFPDFTQSGDKSTYDLPLTLKGETAAQDLNLHGKFLKVNIKSSPYVTDTQPQTYSEQYSYSAFVYPDYLFSQLSNNKMVCNVKNLLEGLNGVTVLCDKPAFIHTLICSVSYEDDIKMWETRGIDVGVKSASSSFDFTIPYDKIPDGYYYTTIVHYADGYSLMTPVKQKNSMK